MDKKILVLILSLSLVLLTLLIAGCTVSQTKYVCGDGSIANSVSECPIIEPTERVLETTKYICPDKTIVANVELCPEVNPVTITKYQCQDGSLRDKFGDCPKVEKTETKITQTESGQCLKLLNHYGTLETYGYYKIRGGVKNDCSVIKRYVQLIFTFYDSNNNVLGTGFTYTDPSDMPAGMTAGFEKAYTDEGISARIARYEVYLTSY